MHTGRIARALEFVAAAWLAINSTNAQCHTWSTEFANLSPQGQVYALQPFDDGTGPALWVGGNFGGVCCPGAGTGVIAKWDGHSWQAGDPLQSLDDEVDSLAVYDSGSGPSIYAGGYFDYAPSPGGGIARWDGTSWTPVHGGLIDPPYNQVSVMSMSVLDTGQSPELYVAGGFSGADQNLVHSRSIVKWNGSDWAGVGGGLGNAPQQPVGAYATAVFDDGSGPALFVGGLFSTAGGTPTGPIAKWNGTSWSGVGAPGNGTVFSLAVYDDGHGPALYASGNSMVNGGPGIARWDGLFWNPLAVSPAAEVIYPFDDGSGPSLFAGGYCSAIGGPISCVARWDGAHWSEIGTINGQIDCLGAFDDGTGSNLFVGGWLTSEGGGIHASGITKWISCHGPINSVCPGDATLAACPCSNSGQSGHGCNNSVSSGGAQLSHSGATNPDTLVLTSANELPSSLSIFLQGDSATPMVASFGDGLRCTGGNLLRLFVESAVHSTAQAPQPGDPSISARSAALGDPIQPGSIRYYQTYYRDPSTTFCPSPTGGTFNVSNGLRVTW
jgi:hypothetical protein